MGSLKTSCWSIAGLFFCFVSVWMASFREGNKTCRHCWKWRTAARVARLHRKRYYYCREFISKKRNKNAKPLLPRSPTPAHSGSNGLAKKETVSKDERTNSFLFFLLNLIHWTRWKANNVHFVFVFNDDGRRQQQMKTTTNSYYYITRIKRYNLKECCRGRTTPVVIRRPTEAAK